MAVQINGWSISQRGGQWQAVNSDGVVGLTHNDKHIVEAFAKKTNPFNFGKR